MDLTMDVSVVSYRTDCGDGKDSHVYDGFMIAVLAM